MSKRIYIMESNGLFKIGVAADPEKRLLSLKTGNPQIKLVYASEKIGNAYAIESEFHRCFSAACVGGEWFSFQDLGKIIDDVRQLINKNGILGENTSLTDSSENTNALVNWVLQEKRDKLEKIGMEIEVIDRENKELEEKLITLGWPAEEIEALINEAKESVLLIERIRRLTA